MTPVHSAPLSPLSGNAGKRPEKPPTERQYDELQRYEHGRGSWMFRPPSKTITRRGWLTRVPNSGETRESSAFQITDAGREALALFRDHYGVPSGL